jgi:DNA end-binding protein Ku
VWAVLRDAILRSGKIALSRVVIARPERAVAIIPMGHGLVVHTAHEERDMNNTGEVFDRLPDGKTASEMVALATHS